MKYTDFDLQNLKEKNSTGIRLSYIPDLVDEILRLRNAIRHHREQTGHQMCWENDEELWKVLDDQTKITHAVPSWPEFMQKCVEYRKSKDS
jgi:hypothetical protein